MMVRALLFGLLAAAGAGAWTLLEWGLGWHGSRAEVGAWTGFVGLLFPLVLISWGLRREKRREPAAFGWRQGLSWTAVCAPAFAAVGAAFFAVYHGVLNPEFGRRMAEAAAPAQAEAVRAAYAPASQAMSVGVSALIVAILIGAVATALLMRGSRAAPS